MATSVNSKTALALEHLQKHKKAFVTHEATHLDRRRNYPDELYVHENSAQALVRRGLATYGRTTEGYEIIELVEQPS